MNGDGVNEEWLSEAGSRRVKKIGECQLITTEYMGRNWRGGGGRAEGLCLFSAVANPGAWQITVMRAYRGSANPDQVLTTYVALRIFRVQSVVCSRYEGRASTPTF